MSPTPNPIAGKPTSRWLGWVVAVLMALPVALAVGRFSWIRLDQWRAEREAVRQLAGPTPSLAAYGVLGGIRLEQGRLTEALPLLQKASDLEWASRGDSRNTLSLAKACLGLSRSAEAEVALNRADALADGLARGQQARTLFSAGLFWQEAGRKAQALSDLGRAVVLQTDDWVDLGGGQREKVPGLASYYQKMLAAAEQDR